MLNNSRPEPKFYYFTPFSLQEINWTLTCCYHSESFGNSSPRGAKRHKSLNVAVLPCLWLVIKEIQRIHVPHAVSYKDHRTSSLFSHLLDHMLQLQEVLFVLI